ncbi:MAG: MBL fold metallo-hydrolase [Phycisphaerales bacterium]|nr:MBL fold metallo-hydrolase [Phycisphaerales bacterium]
MTATVHTIDLRYLDLEGAAAAFLVVPDRDAPFLFECGPMACIEALEEGIRAIGVRPEEVEHLFVTRVHLDHAGAAGAFAARGTTVHVHPRGARHLVDPERLVASSRRVHGAAFDRHYGAPMPCAEERVAAVEDGAVVAAGGIGVKAVETPGHARHHHAWLVEIDGRRTIFAGDVAAMRVPGSDFVSIPMPPPEFEFDPWRRSIERLRSERPDTIVLTHFGAVDDPLRHLEAVESRLGCECRFVSNVLESGVDEDAALDAYRAWLHPQARAGRVDEERLASFLGPPIMRMNLAGVRRWRDSVGPSDGSIPHQS